MCADNMPFYVFGLISTKRGAAPLHVQVLSERVDCDYRGEIRYNVYNSSPTETLCLDSANCIAQLAFVTTPTLGHMDTVFLSQDMVKQQAIMEACRRGHLNELRHPRRFEVNKMFETRYAHHNGDPEWNTSFSCRLNSKTNPPIIEGWWVSQKRGQKYRSAYEYIQHLISQDTGCNMIMLPAPTSVAQEEQVLQLRPAY